MRQALSSSASAAGSYVVSLRLVHYLVEADLLLDDAVLRAPPCWSIRCRRLTTLFVALDDSGFQWPEIDEPNLTVAAARLRAHMRPALASLTVAQRTIMPADTIAATTSMPSPLQMLTAKRLKGDDADLDVWVQFRAILAYSFAPDDITGADLANICATLLEVCGGDAVTRLIAAAQAARIANVFEASRAPAALVFYAAEADCLTQILRLQDAPETRFAYLLKLGWRTYSVLNDVFTAQIDGPSAVRLISEAAVQLNLGAKLSDAVVTSVCNALKVHLPDLDLSEAAHASNEDRLHWLLRQHGESGKGRAGASSSAAGASKGTDAQWNALYVDESYKSLFSALSALDVAPLDLHTVAGAMMRHEHPAGLIFLANGDTMRQPLWKKFSGVTPSILDAVVSSAIRLDSSGAQRPEWGPMLEPGTARKLVRGDFELRGANKLDLWNSCLRALVRHRDGEHVAARFPAGAPAHGLLLDPEMLRITQDALRTIFDAVGYTGSRRLTFASTLFTIHKRATTLAYLPDAIPQKAGLVADFEEAVLLLFDDAAAAHRAMVKTAAPFARRSVAPAAHGDASATVIFSPESSSGVEKMRELDEHLDRILEDLRLEPSLRRSATLRTITETQQASTPLQIVMQKSKRPPPKVPGDDEPPRKKLKDDEKSPALRGDLARKNGVYSGESGVLFGIKVVAFTPPGGQSITDYVNGLNCVGRIAPGDVKERARWCTNRRCDGSHARPKDITNGGHEWFFASDIHASEDDVLEAYPHEHVPASSPGAAASARQSSRRRASGASASTSRGGGRGNTRGRGRGRAGRAGRRGN